MNDKKIEIIVITFGIIITGILGYGQWSIGDNQNVLLQLQIESQERLAKEHIQSQKNLIKYQIKSQEKQTVDQIEIQTMSLVSSHFSNLSKNGEEGKMAEKTVMIAANFLADKYGRRSLAKMAKELVSQRKDVSAQVALRVSEAAEELPNAKKELSWFTVLGSYDEYNLKKAKEASLIILTKVRKNNPSVNIDIYKTKYSRHFAVVIGGKQTKKAAELLSIKARKLGWADDAYFQLNRDWEIVK
jgi:hypothetical protein